MRSTKRSGRSASSHAWQWKDKGLWLRRAYNEVLHSIPMAGEVEEKEAPEERLVVVYGVTQSGKTALILQLVGVAEEHMKRVYRLIRGGAKQGRSSTSHAFLYRRSEDDCFRVWTQAGVAADRENSTQLEREEDVSRYVDGLREQMNRGDGQTDVIGLAIPRKYCCEDQCGYSLNLLDMPGVGSKDRLEQPHVARLMEQYARLAAVTVVVCPLSQIQSLNDLRIPADENYWWENRKKVLLVATYAYSTLEDQEERELWANCESAEEFCRRSMALCQGKLDLVYREWAGSTEGAMPLELFPVDLDESLRQYEKRLATDQRALLSQAQAKVLSELRESVARRENGNCFPLFIQSLNSRVMAHQERLKKGLKTERCRLEKLLDNTDKSVCEIQEKLAGGNRELDELRVELSGFPRTLLDRKWSLARIDLCCEAVEQMGSNFLEVLPLDKESAMLSAVQECAEDIWDKLRDEWESRWKDQINKWCWAEQARMTDRLEAEWVKLQARAEALTDECCHWVRKKVQDELWPSIKKCRDWAGERCMKLLNGLGQAEADYIARICALGQEREKAVAARIARLEELRSGLEHEDFCLRETLKGLEETRRREENQAQAAQKLLDNARGIARRHYLLQRDQVIQALRAERDPDERLNLLLLLAGMEQDYNNDINM